MGTLDDELIRVEFKGREFNRDEETLNEEETSIFMGVYYYQPPVIWKLLQRVKMYLSFSTKKKNFLLKLLIER